MGLGKSETRKNGKPRKPQKERRGNTLFWVAFRGSVASVHSSSVASVRSNSVASVAFRGSVILHPTQTFHIRYNTGGIRLNERVFL
jgi:hypothetical protein